MINSDNVFIGDERERFLQAVAETVVKHNISVKMIQDCLPIMGALRDNGWNPNEILAAVMPLGGDRPKTAT